MAGEMLEAADNAALLQALEVALYHFASHLRLVGEGTRTNNHIAGVGVHIGHGGEINVKAILLYILADSRCGLQHILGASGCGNVAHGCELGNPEVGIIADTGHRAAFLIHAKQGLAGKGAEVCNKLGQLGRVFDVVAEKDNASRRIYASGLAHPVIHSLQVIGFKDGGGIVIDVRVQSLGANKEHRPYLLLEGHLL